MRFAIRYVLMALVLILLFPSLIAADEYQETGGKVFSTDFSEHEVGKGVPKGWKEYWGTSFYEIASEPSRLIKRSRGGVRHMLAWENVGLVEGDVEIATLIKVPDNTLPTMNTTAFQIHLHGSGEAGAINSYFIDYGRFSSKSGGIRIRKSVDHSQSTIANTLTPFELHTWHNLVFQREGDMLRVKIWPYFTDEPEEWTLEGKDDTHHSGRVGVGFFSERHTQEFAWFSVGMGEESAERAPRDIEGIERPQIPDSGTIEIKGEAKHSSIVLQWPRIAGADHYEIMRNNELIAEGWENPSFSDPYIVPNQTYTYQVRGVSAQEGTGEWSNEITVTSEPLTEQLQLPFELEQDSPWTTHEQELDFLKDLESTSSRVKVEEIGQSGEGRPIHLVRFGLNGSPVDKDKIDRPTVLFNAGNHGDEKGSQEAMLFFIRDLAMSDEPEIVDFLQQYEVLVIPKANPDGAAAYTRQTVKPVLDPNRDYVNLITSETQTVTKVIRDFEPILIVDAHEWQGSPGTQRGELQVSAHGNLNTFEDVSNLSSELAFDRIMHNANEFGGWRTTPYQELYGQPSRLRQIGGLKHSLNLLTEGSRHPEIRRIQERNLSFDSKELRPRQVSMQRFAFSETMIWATKNVERIVAATNESRRRAEENIGAVYTDGSLADPPSKNNIINPPPCGWLLTSFDDRVLQTLELHNVMWEEHEEGVFVPAAQKARAMATVALDDTSPDQLDGIESVRVGGESGSCASVDKRGLEELVASIKGEKLEKSDYTEASWQAFETALSSAEEVLFNKEATQAEIDESFESLMGAYEGLGLSTPSVDKQGLEELVGSIKDEKLEETDYTEASWQAFETALSIAEEVLSNEEATQSEVDESFESLTEAYEGLELSTPPVDKQGLEELVESIKDKKLEKSDYTEASWQAFEIALSVAEAALSNEKATQIEVDEVFKSLTSAYEGLELSSIDRESLEALVASIKDENLEESDYTKASWQAFKAALSSAEEVLSYEDATQEEIETAFKTIKKAYEGLENATLPVNKEGLEELISMIKGEKLEKSDYTKVSWQALTSALSKAEEILSNKEATQVEVDYAFESLASALEGLELSTLPVDKETLEKLLASIKAEKLKAADYTKDSWQAFETALSIAEEVLSKEEAKQTQVDEAVKSLMKAYEGLTLSPPPKATIDKKKLRDLVAKIKGEKLEETDYTKESWQALQDALQEAEAVLNDVNVTQKDVDNAMKALQDAHYELKKLSKQVDDTNKPKATDDANNFKRIKEGSKDEMGKKLPSTATDIYNLILLGFAVFSVGAAFVYFRFRKVKDK